MLSIAPPPKATKTITYTYGNSSWGDLLTKYNGINIGYDAIGNMTSYNGYTYIWQGRQLSQISNNSNTYRYTYDSDGIRTSKTVNGTTTEYFLNGNQILAEKTGDNTMWFFYDSEGNRIGMIRNGYAFYYLYNLQGDVIGLMDARNGQIVATYSYDAWGNCTVQNASGWTVGTANPFRYRGYYYDAETGLYYLNSRYYSPEFGRFISADVFISTGQGLQGANMFAYCGNNPVNKSDPSGKLAGWIIGGLVGGLIGGFSSAAQGRSFWAGAAQGAVSGAIAGAAVDVAMAVVATGGVAGVAVAGVIAFAGGAVGNIAGEEAYSIVSTGKTTKIDGGMLKRSAVAGVINVASMGFSTLLKHADEGIRVFNRSPKVVDICSAAGKNLGDITPRLIDSVSAFSAIHYTVHVSLLSALIK